MRRKEEIKTEVEMLLRDVKDKQAVTEALTFLFPKLGDVLAVPTSQYAQAPGRSPRRRISNAEFARSYFNLAPDEILWGKSQTDAMAAGDPTDAFMTYRSRIAQASPHDRAKLRRVFVDLLSSVTRQTDRPVDWFMALLDNARVLLEHVPDANLGFFDLAIETHITSILAEILKLLDEDMRCEVIFRAIQDAADISFLCDVFRSMAGDVEREGAKGQSTNAFGDNTDSLRQELVDKVIEIANSLALYEQARPQDILWFWWGSGYGEQVRQHTAKAMENPVALLCLMEISITTVWSSIGNYERVDRRSWSKIVDIEELNRRAITISKQAVGPAVNTARRFLAAYDRNNQDEF